MIFRRLHASHQQSLGMIDLPKVHGAPVVEEILFKVRDVFTPTKPARVAFVERDAVNDKLVNALSTPGKQIVVYGHSGSGKTTLLVNKLNQVYEQHLVSRCMRGVTFEQLILDGFDQLAPYYTIERTSVEKNSISAELSGSYLSIQAKLNASSAVESGKKEARLLPPQLTPQALGRFMGAAKCCWVLEDFHKVEEQEKAKLSQLMKIFMDLSDDYEDLKIVALGAVDTARQVVDYDHEMRNRVAEIRVDLMLEKELEAIISKGEEALNIRFGQDLKSLIAKYSNGLASACHHLCLNMCDAAGITMTTPETVTLSKKDFEKAIKVYVEEASDSIKSAFDKALKPRRKTQFDNAKLILMALCEFKEGGASRNELHKKICAFAEKYPHTNLKYFLPKLSTVEYGGIVRFDSNSGLYSFADPIYRAFALAHFRPEKSGSGDAELNGLLKLLTSELAKTNTEKIHVWLTNEPLPLKRVTR
jgi:energy-coupling factor transporter ATP-binding protein EcfA2